MKLLKKSDKLKENKLFKESISLFLSWVNEWELKQNKLQITFSMATPEIESSVQGERDSQTIRGEFIKKNFLAHCLIKISEAH